MKTMNVVVLGLIMVMASAETGSFPPPPPNVDVDHIVHTCYEHLESHLCKGAKWGLPFHFYRPSLQKYSADQWLWDSGAHMIVWSQKNISNAVADMRTMLQMQQPDGRIPEQVYWSDRSAKENAELLLTYSNTKFTDTTQMPVLPYSLRAIFEHAETKEDGKAYLKEFLPPLIRYFQWWRATRDTNQDGLVTAIHNWETGLDASPAYDPAYDVYITNVNATSWSWLYPKFIEVVESYKFLYKWNVTEILARDEAPSPPKRLDSWFKVKDLALNCVYASGWRILGELAKEMEEMEEEDGNGTSTAIQEMCLQEAKTTSRAIQTHMWDASQQRFQTVYTDVDGVDKFAHANTIQNLFPLLLEDLPEGNVTQIVQQLQDKTKFSARFSVPTVAMDDPQFCPTFDADLMWRGPVWGFTNWFLLEGLGLHNQWDVQSEILTSWVTLVQQSGIYEHYNPFTGEGYGAVGLGMSTLVCDWIFKYGWA